jgi:hypothetical protein
MLTNNGLGYILADFFTNPSGNPDSLTDTFRKKTVEAKNNNKNAARFFSLKVRSSFRVFENGSEEI